MRTAIKALALLLMASPAAAQIYLPPGVGLPPQSVIGNTLPQSGDAVAVPFSQLKAALNVPSVTNCPASQWVRSLAAGGIVTCSQPALTDVSGFGTNVTTFLATPTSANLAAILTNETGTGAAVFNNAPTLVTPNLGTPSAVTLTNATGLPLSSGISGFGTGVATALGLTANTTGGFATVPISVSVGNISGLGTGVATALGVNVGSAGAFVVNGGALGTPSSGTLTSATGLPISTGVSGLGTGCATFLGTPSSANLRGCATDETGTGLLYFQGGDIGTPSAGVGTNLTALNGTQITSGTIPAARTNGHQNGTATNDNAAAGEIGQYVEAIVTAGAPTSLTTSTAISLTSISLTAGDWDVDTVASFLPAATTSQTQVVVSMSGTTNTLDTAPGKLGIITTGAFVSGGSQSQVSLPPYRLSLSGTTTVFMVVQSNFTISTMTSYGIIRARRVR